MKIFKNKEQLKREIGNNSFGITLVKGNNLVPCPAKGIIACFII